MTLVRRRGLLLVLSSPSGAGKTSITRALIEREQGLRLSVSVTTRPQRPGEIDGQHYSFIDEGRFTQMAEAGELLEHATVFGNRYGTPRGFVEAALGRGEDIITDVDWQGTQQLKQNLRDDLVSIFILPPTVGALEQRLRARAQDSDEIVRQRMSKSADEMSHWPEYDYVIVNEELEASVGAARAILTAERLRRERQVGLADFVNELRRGA
jgi:guanylate kinase